MNKRHSRVAFLRCEDKPRSTLNKNVNSALSGHVYNFPTWVVDGPQKQVMPVLECLLLQAPLIPELRPITWIISPLNQKLNGCGKPLHLRWCHSLMAGDKRGIFRSNHHPVEPNVPDQFVHILLVVGVSEFDHVRAIPHHNLVLVDINAMLHIEWGLRAHTDTLHHRVTYVISCESRKELVLIPRSMKLLKLGPVFDQVGEANWVIRWNRVVILAHHLNLVGSDGLEY